MTHRERARRKRQFVLDHWDEFPICLLSSELCDELEELGLYRRQVEMVLASLNNEWGRIRKRNNEAGGES